MGSLDNALASLDGDNEVDLQSLNIDKTSLSLTEDGGDLVAEDDVGNVVLRYDEDSGSWVMDSLKTKRVNTDYLYAGSFDGPDADTRLGNAISAASTGQTIYLEEATYTTSRTISKILKLKGTHGKFRGSLIDAVFTLDASSIIFENIGIISTDQLKVIGDNIMVKDCSLGNASSVDVSGKKDILYGLNNGTINLESASEKCVVDTSTGVSVNDSGINNVVGDIA